ncbi:hypothetical protein Gbth_119_004 [Gluconobacter thailandicus F149-1 = NBRC 100600]|uniref:Uncharacterized protein n=1 Tax=Gluconobacter thailandicus NBRC 3257 TaxID=1381097 RepID=A0ABQ0J1J6_GLUTH|nr:hypothetical protein [Gluconobacter thailandicus]KXV55117.1 hypothetical protein AD946_00280 [Gluconobacter thailandicus]GAC89524.1 hypothetical protein NBRC3255_3185 [Gluconobacter thailandicus NBRC 3255]GAD28330.1 hypothetical protein NBRC3257_3329 [Gluconobacter thailandicus NBRC 3257]GAN94863.1 hypothetical protein Gbth_119_004 [Gluconobacter thailandicus F149-1 = NBRC 100600]GBR60092.1 hypothetical protein AA100600_1714 [Gluconobacter thailandicus F149-1 = NBRC 100600]
MSRLFALFATLSLTLIPQAQAASEVGNFLNQINAGKNNPEAGFEEYLKATRTSKGLIWQKDLAKSCEVHIKVIPRNMQDDSMKCEKSYLIPDSPSGSEFTFIVDKYIFTFFSQKNLPRNPTGENSVFPIYKMAQLQRELPGSKSKPGVNWLTRGACTVELPNKFQPTTRINCQANDGKISVAIFQEVGVPE